MSSTVIYLAIIEENTLPLDISVIFATHNRAKELGKTLDGMVRTEKADLAVEFIVVDNGSTDQTKSVVNSFASCLQIRYIFEPRSGKNCALNTALEQCKLGKIVVFTDDDVDVSADWLVSIRSVCDRWPNHAVFGGRINVIFPHEKIPSWASDPYLSSLGFARHDYSHGECVYSGGVTPFGPNYWVRREIFDNGRRFNESIGPRPTNRIMGSETSFLVTLLKDGYEFVYAPTVNVSHRIQTEMLKLSSIYRRAYRWGRGQAHIFDLPEQSLLTKCWPRLSENRLAWRFYRTASVVLYAFKTLASFTFSNKTQRPLNVVKKMEMLGYRVEAMHFASQVPAKLRKTSSQDRHVY